MKRHCCFQQSHYKCWSQQSQYFSISPHPTTLQALITKVWSVKLTHKIRDQLLIGVILGGGSCLVRHWSRICTNQRAHLARLSLEHSRLVTVTTHNTTESRQECFGGAVQELVPTYPALMPLLLLVDFALIHANFPNCRQQAKDDNEWATLVKPERVWKASLKPAKGLCMDAVARTVVYILTQCNPKTIDGCSGPYAERRCSKCAVRHVRNAVQIGWAGSALLAQ